jgi:16S rRNA (adenine1518-N6/adenine1519-N6)-dimethyltransferase
VAGVTGVVRLLGAGDIRGIAGRLGLRPTKRLGQNFVIEPGSVRRIAALAAVCPGDVILEVGPGLGSLTLALLAAAVEAAAPADAGRIPASAPPSAAGEAGGIPAAAPSRVAGEADGNTVAGQGGETGGIPVAAPPHSVGDAGGISGTAPSRAAGEADVPDGARVLPAGPGLIPVRLVAVEIDPVLADELPKTIAHRAPEVADRVTVLTADALAIGEQDVGAPAPTVLAANLPYNVAVPVVLHLLAALPALERGVVMVQAEVADRMCAGPGSRVYGVPSAKLAWYAAAKLAGTVPRSVFWPAPNVDSKLVAFTRRDPPPTTASRAEVFAVIDAAFGQRRKTLRAALATWAGSPAEAERVLRAADVDPGARGEALAVTDFARIAAARACPG